MERRVEGRAPREGDLRLRRTGPALIALAALLEGAGGLMATVARGTSEFGVLLVIGLTAAPYWFPDADASAPLRAARAPLLIGVTIALAAVVRIIAQARGIALPGDAIAPLTLAAVHTIWGRIVLLHACVAIVWGAGFRDTPRPSHVRSIAQVGAALFLAAGPGLTGHAIADPYDPAFAVTITTLHVIAAGVWIGGVALLAARARRASPEMLLRAMDAFHRVALGAVITILSCGVILIFRRGPDITDWLVAPYGEALVIKLAIASFALALGAWHARAPDRRPAPTHRRLVRSLAAETAFFAGVIAATAVLAGTSPEP